MERRAAFRATRIQNFNRNQMLRNYGLTESEIEVECQVPFTSILEALPSPVTHSVFALEPDDRPTSLAEVRKSFEKILAPPQRPDLLPLFHHFQCACPAKEPAAFFRLLNHFKSVELNR
jgi:hypothetical protein